MSETRPTDEQELDDLIDLLVDGSVEQGQTTIAEEMYPAERFALIGLLDGLVEAADAVDFPVVQNPRPEFVDVAHDSTNRTAE